MTDYYQVLYDTDEYLKKPGVKPLHTVEAHPDLGKATDIVRKFLLERWRETARPAAGRLRFPFLRPGATYWGLWDWDAFFIACALPDEGVEYGRGSIADLLDGVREDGRPPKAASPDGTKYDYDSTPIPLQAQFACLMAKRANDFRWVDPYWSRLEKVRAWYERETVQRERYFVWLSFHGNGVDNNPSVYGRPARSSAGVDLACWNYRENLAMAAISRELGKKREARYVEKAAAVRDLIRTRYWDQIDELFYNIDCLASEKHASRQGIGWECFLKFRNWISLFPLWARAATPAQAQVLRKKIMDPSEFLSDAGVRSHSKRDPIYNNTPTGNPSNWQGPVWGLSTFLTAYGLAHYGFKDDAADVAGRQVRIFAGDILANGCLHEFYHGDTGQPLLNPGFLSWDLLALDVMDDLRDGRDCTSLDLYDSA